MPRRLHILGQVSFPWGYPVTGKYGEEVAKYTLQFDNGKTQDLPVRTAIEVRKPTISMCPRALPRGYLGQPALVL